MIKHIVEFRFRSDVDEETRKEQRELFRKRILALRDELHFVKYLEVGFNVNPQEQWDICLVSHFDNLDDVARYSQYPAHVEAAAELKKWLDGRACVDFEVE